MSYIDIKEINECKVKFRGKELSIVSMLRKDGKLYVMLAGGYLLEVDQETYDRFYKILGEHLKKHIFKKK
jgi:hypothetical protein